MSDRPDAGWGAGATPPAPPARPRHPSATLALVLSIVGFLFWPIAIGGIVLGNRVRRDALAQPGGFHNEGVAQAARILGWIVVVLGALWTLAYLVALVAGGRVGA